MEILLRHETEKFQELKLMKRDAFNYLIYIRIIRSIDVYMTQIMMWPTYIDYLSFYFLINNLARLIKWTFDYVPIALYI